MNTATELLKASLPPKRGTVGYREWQLNDGAILSCIAGWGDLSWGLAILGQKHDVTDWGSTTHLTVTRDDARRLLRRLVRR